MAENREAPASLARGSRDDLAGHFAFPFPLPICREGRLLRETGAPTLLTPLLAGLAADPSTARRGGLIAGCLLASAAAAEQGPVGQVIRATLVEGHEMLIDYGVSLEFLAAVCASAVLAQHQVGKGDAGQLAALLGTYFGPCGNGHARAHEGVFRLVCRGVAVSGRRARGCAAIVLRLGLAGRDGCDAAGRGASHPRAQLASA